MRRMGLILLGAGLALQIGRAAAECDLDGDFRQHPGTGPSPVHVTLKVNEFRDINEAEGSFTLDLEMTTVWNDPRLAAAIAAAASTDACMLSVEDLWRPDLAFTNIVSVQEQTAPYRVLQRDGTVVEWRRHVATFAAAFDVADFPFDRQQLEIGLIERQSAPADVTLMLAADGSALPAASNWRVSPMVGTSGTRKIGSGPSAPSVAALDIAIPIARTWFVPFVNIFLPIFGCTLVALSVYFLPRDDGGNRIAISSTALLIAAAFAYLMSGYISEELSLTPIDLFFWASIAIPFVAFVAALASIPLVSLERDAVVGTMDRVLLASSAALFAILSYLAWFHR